MSDGLQDLHLIAVNLVSLILRSVCHVLSGDQILLITEEISKERF